MSDRRFFALLETLQEVDGADEALVDFLKAEYPVGSNVSWFKWGRPHW